MDKLMSLKTGQKGAPLDSALEPKASVNTHTSSHLSREETRKIVTPYAFFVADDLLGTPLAGPFRRGFAMLIDLFLISLLTQVSSLILAAVAAGTFFRADNRLKNTKKFNTVRIFLRLLVALLMFVVVMGIVDEVKDDNFSGHEPSDKLVDDVITVGGEELVALTAKYLLHTDAIKEQVAQGECKPAYDCLKIVGEELVQDAVGMGLDKGATVAALESFLGSVSATLSAQQHTELTFYLKKTAEIKQSSTSNHLPPDIKAVENKSENDKHNTQSNSFISWLENFVEELGLGFGWAAFYFSIFTAWWRGQTPGKKLMGMKVIKLDNTALNLWESFGRYGGYAAGFATGLTGFLQVLWDPNRQAIQDKISETLVIDLRKPKVPFAKEMVE
jgi:hypothetical protein